MARITDIIVEPSQPPTFWRITFVSDSGPTACFVVIGNIVDVVGEVRNLSALLGLNMPAVLS